MSDQVDLARGWLDKAASDLHAGYMIVESDGPYDTACFHAQQTIEKSLKGILALYAQPIPRTHDLEELQRLCLTTIQLPDLVDIDLSEASDYGVAVRYDLEFWPDQATAADAMDLAQRVLFLVIEILPPHRRPSWSVGDMSELL